MNPQKNCTEQGYLAKEKEYEEKKKKLLEKSAGAFPHKLERE